MTDLSKTPGMYHPISMFFFEIYFKQQLALGTTIQPKKGHPWDQLSGPTRNHNRTRHLQLQLELQGDEIFAQASGYSKMIPHLDDLNRKVGGKFREARTKKNLDWKYLDGFISSDEKKGPWLVRLYNGYIGDYITSYITQLHRDHNKPL